MLASRSLSLYLSLSALYITVVPLDIDATREIIGTRSGNSEASILGIAFSLLQGNTSTIPELPSSISGVTIYSNAKAFK